ncbi:FAD-dependent thymidylate synthase [bacterium]|nr:FAD-dependent thymidylate synthase [bacterium]
MIQTFYVDHMGTDLSVANAARVSFGKRSEMDTSDVWGPPKLKGKDAKLIRYLAKHKHISPFGHCFASFHVKAPVFVARQLVKHKFLRWNEISRRYVDHEPEFYQPTEWRGRSVDAKQGSEGVTYPDPDIISFYEHTALRSYNELLEHGVCPEQARMVLPQSMVTEWYWSGSLDAFADMCNLRCKPDTQYETQVVAGHIDTEMAKLFPVSWKALRENE